MASPDEPDELRKSEAARKKKEGDANDYDI
jgi:hypothetical protein